MVKPRTTPRSFDLHWGKGQIVEEARCEGEHHEPSIQLLEFEDKSQSLRFCWYDHRGRFQRSPLIVGKPEMAGLKQSLKENPRLKKLLTELVS